AIPSGLGNRGLVQLVGLRQVAEAAQDPGAVVQGALPKAGDAPPLQLSLPGVEGGERLRWPPKRPQRVDGRQVRVDHERLGVQGRYISGRAGQLERLLGPPLVYPELAQEHLGRYSLGRLARQGDSLPERRFGAGRIVADVPGTSR